MKERFLLGSCKYISLKLKNEYSSSASIMLKQDVGSVNLQLWQMPRFFSLDE